MVCHIRLSFFFIDFVRSGSAVCGSKREKRGNPPIHVTYTRTTRMVVGRLFNSTEGGNAGGEKPASARGKRNARGSDDSVRWRYGAALYVCLAPFVTPQNVVVCKTHEQKKQKRHAKKSSDRNSSKIKSKKQQRNEKKWCVCALLFPFVLCWLCLSSFMVGCPGPFFCLRST